MAYAVASCSQGWGIARGVTGTSIIKSADGTPARVFNVYCILEYYLPPCAHVRYTGQILLDPQDMCAGGGIVRSTDEGPCPMRKVIIDVFGYIS